MSQGRECCQVVVAAVGSSDSPLGHLQYPLCRPPQLVPGSLRWDGKVAPRRYLQSHQPRGPGAAQAVPGEPGASVQLPSPHPLSSDPALLRLQPQSLDH